MAQACSARTGPAAAGVLTGRSNVTRLLAVLFAIGIVMAVAGCGSSSNSKPQYCTDKTNLEKSVKALPSTITSGNVSAIQSQVTKIQGEANKFASSAKSEFSSQAAAVKKDVNTLETGVKGLPSSPSASDLMTLATDAASTVSAVSDLVNAVKSKCS